MRIHYRLLWLLALLTGPEAPAQTMADRINDYLVAAENAGFNGSVLVAQHGRVLLNAGYGWSSLSAGKRNDSLSIFQVGSLTKQFTAASLLLLQQRGRLSIHDPLSRFFPDFPRAKDITLEQLLSHTSGVHNYTEDGRLMATRSHQPISEDDMMKLLAAMPPDFEPGAQFHYSNSGYLILGYVIEKAGGESYEQFLRQHILEPLGMKNSGFDFKALESTHKTTGYAMLRENRAVPAAVVDSSFSFAAGALYSTTGDFYRWNMALINNGLLSAASTTEMFTARKSNYGLGVGKVSLFGKVMITHDGGIDGFSTHNSIMPADSTVITVFCNGPGYSPGKAGQDILRILNNQPVELPKARKVIDVPENMLQSYTGVYQLSPGFDITISLEQGQLKAQATNQPGFDLYAEKENLFFLKTIEASIEFVKDADGKVNKLILHQNGREMPGIRKQP